MCVCVCVCVCKFFSFSVYSLTKTNQVNNKLVFLKETQNSKAPQSGSYHSSMRFSSAGSRNCWWKQ